MARETRFSLWHTAARTRLDPLWQIAGAALTVSLGHAVHGASGALIFGVLALLAIVTYQIVMRLPVRAGSLLLRDGTLRRHDQRGNGDLLVSRGELLGLALLVAPDHDGALLALTTPSRVRVLPIHLRSEDELAPLARLLPPVRSDNHAAAKAGLRSKDAAALVQALLLEFPHAAERLFMRGARGESITLDRSELHVEGSRILLDRPYEMRAFAFFERSGSVVSAYQAAWIKQVQDLSKPWDPTSVKAAHECVFVAALPGEGERGWPILDTAEAAVLLRAERHAVDALLFPSLHRRIEAAQPQRVPASRRPPSAPLGTSQRN